MMDKTNIKLPLKIDLKAIKDKFLFIPIGGCDKIGTNFYLYHYKGHWIGIDYGIGFADKLKTPGVEIMLPSLAFLEANKIKLDGLIITHSHEDHIGGVCEMYKKLNCPIYCTTFAKNFLKVDALDVMPSPNLDIKEIKDGKKHFKIGAFEIELINLTHSTIEAQGVYIKTDKGSVFHTGDWKFDETPVLGKPSDKKRLSEIIKKDPLTLLISDSTNCMKNNECQSEALLVDSLTKIVQSKKHMVVITTFASNISRIHTIYQVAQKTGRRLVTSGRSMDKIIAIAQESGYLHDIDWLDAKDARKMPREKLLVLSTGCQGENNASMYKLANNKHAFLKLQPKDCVIFSSKVIPGNELDVSDVINNLIMKGVEIITDKENLTHASGHAYRPELKEMYKLTKPMCFIPMHGDWLMLHEHKKLAKSCGIKNVITPENGCIIEINNNTIEKLGNFVSPAICLDGNRLLDENSKIFKDRKAIANDGFVYCCVVIDKKGKLLSTPEIRTIGLFDFHNNHHIEDMQWIAKRVISSIRPRFFARKVFNKENLVNTLTEAIKREIHTKTLKNPIVDVVVIID